ncbi:hypothetical protein JOD43_003900 [Pullulanibacillus pueri]|uniref:GNAT family N-acetyltransferase n=1 Tax=Pullulanibacillus pueri TaxID=1437324 RepID=A0A8J2ZY14_9BACL|nr:hypothetical protein [Pullulanibacillus pueri]MBM7683720.1 hypothetical protein [Pullulanibacillus pueri]GGH85168.1 hypothetical protein GCM10007096_29930 [Pullulanibacillus pueri]
MEIVKLRKFIDARGEESTNKYLSSFTCEINKDVESFLHENAVECENRHYTRTYLVIDEQNNFDIIGYYTLKTSYFAFEGNVSKTTKQRLVQNKEAVGFESILIAQLGRSDQYKGIVPGKEILKEALHACKQIFESVALRIVTVEYNPTPNLRDFYLSNGFKELQKTQNGNMMSYIRF